MNDISQIAQKFQDLERLSNQEVILIDDIEKEFRPDLKKFVLGETLSINNGQISIGHNLFKKWLTKIMTKGFDYEIDFKK